MCWSAIANGLYITFDHVTYCLQYICLYTVTRFTKTLTKSHCRRLNKIHISSHYNSVKIKRTQAVDVTSCIHKYVIHEYYCEIRWGQIADLLYRIDKRLILLLLYYKWDKENIQSVTGGSSGVDGGLVSAFREVITCTYNIYTCVYVSTSSFWRPLNGGEQVSASARAHTHTHTHTYT